MHTTPDREADGPVHVPADLVRSLHRFTRSCLPDISEGSPMARLSSRRLVSLAVTLAVLAIPTIVAALTAAPCGMCSN
jgi:hypothetical protein